MCLTCSCEGHAEFPSHPCFPLSPFLFPLLFFISTMSHPGTGLPFVFPFFVLVPCFVLPLFVFTIHQYCVLNKAIQQRNQVTSRKLRYIWSSLDTLSKSGHLVPPIDLQTATPGNVLEMHAKNISTATGLASFSHQVTGSLSVDLN